MRQWLLPETEAQSLKFQKQNKNYDRGMNGMQLTGSQIVIECLKEQGVDTVFGYPGGAILNVYDELYKHKDEIKHILTSHERVLLMRRTDMQEQQEKSVYVLQPADQVQRTL